SPVAHNRFTLPALALAGADTCAGHGVASGKRCRTAGRLARGGRWGAVAGVGTGPSRSVAMPRMAASVHGGLGTVGTGRIGCGGRFGSRRARTRRSRVMARCLAADVRRSVADRGGSTGPILSCARSDIGADCGSRRPRGGVGNGEVAWAAESRGRTPTEPQAVHPERLAALCADLRIGRLAINRINYGTSCLLIHTATSISPSLPATCRRFLTA